MGRRTRLLWLLQVDLFAPCWGTHGCRKWAFQRAREWLAKYEDKCLPHLVGRSGRRLYKKRESLWIELFLTLLNYDSRESKYRETVSGLCKLLQKAVTGSAQLGTDIERAIAIMNRARA